MFAKLKDLPDFRDLPDLPDFYTEFLNISIKNKIMCIDSV